MGITPNAADHRVTTQVRLPSGMKWLQVADLPIGTGTVTVRHDGATKTTRQRRHLHLRDTHRARRLTHHRVTAPTIFLTGIAPRWPGPSPRRCGAVGR